MRTLFVAFAAAAVVAAPAFAQKPAAVVGNRTITMADLEKSVKPKLIEVENARFEALNEGLNVLINEALIEQEAKARGVSPADLKKTEVDSKIQAPTEDQAKALFEQYKDQIEGTFEDSKGQIMDYLKQQQAAAAQQNFLAGLRKKYNVQVNLVPPKVEVGTGGRPARGAKNAKVTIVSFSDYECPFCKRAETVVDEVMKAYGDKVSFVHRDFPLDFHKSARPAAEAARCAEKQGKFWEVHSKLFASAELTTERFKAIGKEVGLDSAKYEKCLGSGEFNAAIDKDMADGQEVGVTGTPAFFINGRPLTGAQPFEEFKKIIDAELAM